MCGLLREDCEKTMVIWQYITMAYFALPQLIDENYWDTLIDNNCFLKLYSVILSHTDVKVLQAFLHFNLNIMEGRLWILY